MPLPLSPPVPPMDALSVAEIPGQPGWLYEPKWDGFRCLSFRDGQDVYLQSKSGQPLARYFPEVVEALRLVRSARFVLDGELTIAHGDEWSFELLQLRLHPAESRVRRLAREHPATYVLFDLLAGARGRSLLSTPLRTRRAKLEALVARACSGIAGLALSPVTESHAQAQRWLDEGAAGFDGVVAKRIDADYRSGERTGMVKVKRIRSADCVVGGFRYGSGSRVVGSLLLGLYDAHGLLHHVGFAANIPRDERAELTRRLETLVEPPGFTGRAPGGPSRWSSGRTGEWQPLRPQLVVEVAFDHVSEERFRHGTRFLRWRTDKAPRSCTMDQLSG
jgi:ATP-dependent DNA ligase